MIERLLAKGRRARRRFSYQSTRYLMSIHRFLTLILLGMLTIAIVLIAAANYWQLATQNRAMLMMQLSNAAQLLATFDNISRSKFILSPTDIAQYVELTPSPKDSQTPLLGKQIAFELVNSQTHALISKSHNMPDIQLELTQSGLAEIKNPDLQNVWYAYILQVKDRPVTIVVAMDQSYLHDLNRDLFYRNLNILFVVYIVMAAILLLVIEFALHPLTRVTEAISLRDPDNLLAIRLKRVPIEVRPLIKELNNLFKKVRDTIEREKRFTADAAHELRTPLAALKTQVEVARRESDPEERAAILRNIIKGVNRCAHVIEQLLTLSRLEPQAKLRQMQAVDLCLIATEMVAELAPLAIEKDLDIDLETPEHPLMIIGNGIAIGILLRNLIDNAIRYTPTHGRVTIVIKEHTDHISLQVIDNGPGIPAHLRQRIFERFFRQLGNKAEGSGLGLSIVKQIIRLHQATISARQPESGSGLEMHVSFPLKG